MAFLHAHRSVPNFAASHNYGRISSVMAIFLTLTGISATLGASLLYDRFGSYQPFLWMVIARALAATAVVFFAKRNLPESSRSLVLQRQMVPQTPPECRGATSKPGLFILGFQSYSLDATAQRPTCADFPHCSVGQPNEWEEWFVR